MKEHFYRQHKSLSYECYRCCAGFDTENLLRDHQRRPEGCQLGEQKVDKNRITREQEKELRSKKRSRKNETEEGKWRDIYKIIFPHDSEIPSPYCEVEVQGQLTKFREFTRQRLEPLVINQLKRAAEDSEEFQNEELQRKLPGFFRDVQEDLMARFLQLPDEDEVQDATQSHQSREEPLNKSHPGLSQALEDASGMSENETDDCSEEFGQEHPTSEGSASSAKILPSRTATDVFSKPPSTSEDVINKEYEQMPKPPPWVHLNGLTQSHFFFDATVPEQHLDPGVQSVGDPSLSGSESFPFSADLDIDQFLGPVNTDSSNLFNLDDLFFFNLDS